MRKLVVKIGGGLGNQMYQYALAKYLAGRMDREIFFDLTDFTISTLRKFQLNQFVGPSACRRWGWCHEWAFFLLWIINRKVSVRLFRLILRVLGIKWLFVRNPYVCQSEFADESLIRLKGLVYLSGCYGHVTHMPSRVELRTLFAVANVPSEKNADYLRQIANSESVSIHIRRSDYLWASNGTPVLSADYQHRAIDEMRKRLTHPKWFVFSDDLDWCRSEFSDLEDAVFVEGNGEEPWEDIRLMAACRHHIIANSTFSWWGAYLGAEDGITFYPEPWFGDAFKLPETGKDARWEPVDSRGNQNGLAK